MPTVSIVVNCYNGERFLREALDSIFDQKFEDWEIIFWDNASTDASPQIAKSYGEKLKYFRSLELTTLGCARRSAVEVCTGDWIAFLDTDDIWYPEKLETQIQSLENSDYVLCFAGVEEIDIEGNTIRALCPRYASGDILERQLCQFDINMVTPMMRRETIETYSLNFDDNITASEEYNLFVRLAAKGKVLVQSVVLGKYRVYPGSLTDRQISKWAYERRYTLEQLKAENPGIEQKYPAAFTEAYARANYYDARFYASRNEFPKARESLRSVAKVRTIYKVLLAISYFPFLWRLVHISKRNGLVGNAIAMLNTWNARGY